MTASQNGPGVYCLRPIEFGDNEHGIEWHRINRAFRRRDVQDDGWHHYVGRGVSLGGTGANLPDWWSVACDVRKHDGFNATCQEWSASYFSDDWRLALASYT